MNSDIVSYTPQQLAELARKHFTSLARVKEAIRENGSGTHEQLEAALDRRPEPWWLPVKPGSKGGAK